MTRTSVSLPPPLLDALKRVAVEKGIPLGELIRRALDDFVQRMERDLRTK